MELISEGSSGKYSKMKILVYKFFKKVAYVHIEYSSYQFSGESKGGGLPKKHGPERVNKK